MANNVFKDRQAKESRSFTSQFITMGVKMLKIIKVEIKESKSSSRVQHYFHVETPEIGGDFEGFKREDGSFAKGLIGKVKLGIYFDPESDAEGDTKRKEQFLDDITLMAEKAEVRSELNEINANNWADMLEQFSEIIQEKFMWFVLTAEEYAKGKFALSFASAITGKNEEGGYDFSVLVKHKDFGKTLNRDEQGNLIQVEGVNVVGENAGKKETLTFDPQYHLKPFEESDIEANVGIDMSNTNNDLPF